MIQKSMKIWGSCAAVTTVPAAETAYGANFGYIIIGQQDRKQKRLATTSQPKAKAHEHKLQQIQMKVCSNLSGR
jgi:hypothetical protein